MGGRAVVVSFIALASVLALFACGDESCPPGYVCSEACAPGQVCPSAGATARPPPGVTPPAGSYDGGTHPPPGADAGGYPPGSTVPASSDLHVLAYGVVDAEMTGSQLVMASNRPTNTLHIYDVTTGGDRSVALPAAPVAVAIAPDGATAAVAYDANVSLVDLAAGTVQTTCPVSSDAFDVALSAAGVAYVMPRTSQWQAVHAVDLASCSETKSSPTVYAPARIALHPSGAAVFAGESGLSPSRVMRCAVGAATFSCTDAENNMDWGTHPFCGMVLASADGQRLYDGCGTTLRIPATVTSPCTYGGSLEGISGMTQARHLYEVPAAQRIVLVPSTPYAPLPPGVPGASANADTVVRVHETQFLAFVAQYELPMFPISGGAKTVFSHGRFAFAAPAMDKIYAVVQADPMGAALDDYALATLVP